MPTRLRWESREWLLGHHCVPLDMQSRWEAALQTALDVLAQVAPELCVGLSDMHLQELTTQFNS
jgi:hypothetical protein